MTKLTNSAPARGGQPYESPALEIIDIVAEGVLCGSTGDGTTYGSGLGDLTEDTFAW